MKFSMLMVRERRRMRGYKTGRLSDPGPTFMQGLELRL